MRIISPIIATLTLSACTGTGTTEQHILHHAAVEDAKSASPELHEAYLRCYPLPKLQKEQCRRIVGEHHPQRAEATSWDYIRPFDHEAERQGFRHFLNERGKPCDGVNEGPVYDETEKGWQVRCTGGEQHLMRFDAETGSWSL